jgi:GT2 family glycosyltransferase
VEKQAPRHFHERGSEGIFRAAMLDPPRKEPRRSLIVLIPTDYAISSERIAEGLSRVGPDPNVIVACAGQPATLASIHAQLRDAEFLLAPRGTTIAELRMHAFAQASGDILVFVGAERAPAGVPKSAERIASEGSSPSLSIIVPVSDGGEFIDGALSSILESDLAPDAFELIVVDDASDDESSSVAARYADVLIRLSGYPRGAAYARNRGAEQARAQTLAFVNADVRLHTDTLPRLCGLLDGNVVAAGASNDGTSGELRLAARYWNLLYNYGAQKHGGAGTNFNASCGVVRRNAFLSVGMYNEWLFQRASLEGLELGQRLERAGHTVVLSKEITVSHLRHHDVRGVFGTTWRHSAVMVRSLGYLSSRPHARSHLIHALGIPFGLAAILIGAAAGVFVGIKINVPEGIGAGALAVLLVNSPLHLHFARKGGILFSLAVVPLHLVTQIVGMFALVTGFVLRHLIGDPAPDPTTQAFAEVGVKMWPPVPRKRQSLKQESQR